MTKKVFKVKSNIAKQKKLYIILTGLAVISFIFGLSFIFLISKDNLTKVNDKLLLFFQNKEWHNNTIINIFITNIFYITLIFLLGISIIGLPISILIILFKSFLAGFSISSIIYTFGFKGLLYILIEYFPCGIIYGVILILIGFYSVSFSIKLFNYLFLKRIVNFKNTMNKYIKVLLISVVTTVIITIYDYYCISYLLDIIS